MQLNTYDASHRKFITSKVLHRVGHQVQKWANHHMKDISTKFSRTTQFRPLDHLVCSKITIYWNEKWRRPTFIIFSKLLYLGNGLSNRHSIWHNDAYWPSEPHQQLNFQTANGRRLQKIKNVVLMYIICSLIETGTNTAYKNGTKQCSLYTQLTTDETPQK